MSLPQQKQQHRRFLTKKKIHHLSNPNLSESRQSAVSSFSDASSTTARLSLSQHSPHLGSAIFDNISYGVQPTSPPTEPHSTSRPPSPVTLPHAHTYDERLLSPKLRLGQEVALGRAMETTPPRGGTSSSDGKSQRYSDEVKPESAKKSKSMFSALLSGVKGTPRRPTISSPVNPTHVTHVSIDNETGKYTVCSHLVTIIKPDERHLSIPLSL